MSSKFPTSRADVDRDIGPTSHTAQLHISSVSAMFLFITVFELRVDTGPRNTKMVFTFTEVLSTNLSKMNLSC